MLKQLFYPVCTEFDYQDHQIRLELWACTGLERVYLDEQLISERRNFSGGRSEHRFHIGQQPVRLQLLPKGIRGMLQGCYDIRLQLHRQTVATDQLAVFSNATLRYSLFIMLAALPLGAVAGSLLAMLLKSFGGAT